MAGKRKLAEQYWKVTHWHDRVRQSMSLCPSYEGAIKISYQTFVSGEGFPEALVTPDQVTIRIDDETKDNEAAEGRESLPTLWDQWLQQHPEERAEWDTGSRRARLRVLEQQHVPNPRPFTSEAIVANPDWYRHLYGIVGMTDEQFDAFLHLHRFAVADKEAQRLAKEREKGTNGRLSHKRRSAAIYLEGYSSVPEHPVVPLEKQERACRAYCKRIGYKAHRVYRAMTPPPHDVPHHVEIGIGPEHAFIYYQRDSNHPYHAAHNLLDARTIDVIVQFVESGPSRRLFGDSLSEESICLLCIELASLWEIEPPTVDERQLDEVLSRLGDAETEEERAALMEELHTISQKMKKTERKTTSSNVTPAREEVPVEVQKPKTCYACRSRPAREGSAFCSDTCAQMAAERYVQATTRAGAANVEHGLAVKAVHTPCNRIPTLLGHGGCASRF